MEHIKSLFEYSCDVDIKGSRDLLYILQTRKEPKVGNLLTKSKIMKNSLFWLCNCFAAFSWSSGGILKASSWSDVTKALFWNMQIFKIYGCCTLIMSPANFWTIITSGGMARISWNLVSKFSWNWCRHVPNFVASPCVKGGYPQGGLYTAPFFMDSQVENAFMDEQLINIWEVSLVCGFIT